MTAHDDQAVSWNDESRISCAFAFKCPKTWDRLTITDDPNTRHCGACDRNVHLVRTGAEFKRQAEAGQCAAVRSDGLMTVGVPAPGYRITAVSVNTELDLFDQLEPMIKQLSILDTESHKADR